MDAAAQLAVMAKAKLVFETPGTFLSFPALSPLSFRPGDRRPGRVCGCPGASRGDGRQRVGQRQPNCRCV